MSDQSNSVVDAGILEVSGDDLSIPTFLARPNEQGQHELVVDYIPPEDLLAAMPEQLAEARVTLNEALSAGTVAAREEDTPEVTQVGNLTHNNQSNQPATPEEMRRDFFKDVNKFGKASGEGASALGRLGLRALRAAADGVLSTAKPQSGGKDDATLVYEAYTAMDSKHAEHTAGGSKANASKLRQIIGMGTMLNIDPVAVGDKVVRIREEMEGADLKPKALFAALVDVARDQQASDVELSDAAIREACTKTKADKTIEKEWEAIQKRVDSLVTGEGSHGLKDQSEGALKISELISEHVKGWKLDGQRNELIEALIEQGYTREMARNIVDKKITT